jgi:hypothetical protein
VIRVIPKSNVVWLIAQPEQDWNVLIFEVVYGPDVLAGSGSIHCDRNVWGSSLGPYAVGTDHRTVAGAKVRELTKPYMICLCPTTCNQFANFKQDFYEALHIHRQMHARSYRGRSGTPPFLAARADAIDPMRCG